MKISVITPSFNQGHFIKETIDSVLNSNYDDIEYIVMDGGSTDDTVDILKSYGDRIIWKSEKDNGQTDAINKGMNLATGDILCFLNSDDYYMADTISYVMDYFKNNNDAMWLSGDYKIVDENGEEIQGFVKKYKNLLKSFPNKMTLKVANYIIQPSTFWRKEVYKTIGPFDEKLNYVMDYDYWLRTIKKYPLYLTKKKLCSFRIHGQSKGGFDFSKQFDEELKICKKYVNNPILVFLHYIHNLFIVGIYKIIK